MIAEAEVTATMHCSVAGASGGSEESEVNGGKEAAAMEAIDRFISWSKRLP